jgi:hypothetical protein
MEPKDSLPPTVPILRQLDPVHTPTTHFLKRYLNITLPSMPRSPKWSLSLRFPHQIPVWLASLPYALHAPLISFFSILSPEQFWVKRTDHWAPHYLFYPLPCYIVPLRHKCSPYHPILNILSLRSSLNVSDQVSHPYKTRGKIIFLYILIFKFSDSKPW